jgi:hypothetical protein
MSYDSTLIRLKELKNSSPDNKLLSGCVDRYEINLIKFKLTQDGKYEIMLNTISKIIDVYMKMISKQFL